MNKLFNREHLVVIIGILLVGLHMVDELAHGEAIAPPFIPLVVVGILYPFLSVTLRALFVIVGGATFFVAQIIGHIMPIIERGPVGSDYTGVLPMIGGAILVYGGVQLLRLRQNSHIEPKNEI